MLAWRWLNLSLDQYKHTHPTVPFVKIHTEISIPCGGKKLQNVLQMREEASSLMVSSNLMMIWTTLSPVEKKKKPRPILNTFHLKLLKKLPISKGLLQLSNSIWAPRKSSNTRITGTCFTDHTDIVIFASSRICNSTLVSCLLSQPFLLWNFQN